MQVNKYMVQIKQEHYEELLERDAWLTALEQSFLEEAYPSGMSDAADAITERALEIYNKVNEVKEEPIHLRLISKIESGDNSPAISQDNAPSSVQYD